ncbi:uncharacterized protein PV09_07606 [Verruconis gallopava]|uniref:BZIP domain-containing protein n=1 Tax=Verruconis gallopava TaxID=253628 RepID=A0A0D1XF62_9PEZI|nr:uncharacterized protein PV09_07606 [Verruconis gallopava]KIW00846.1 hypothetical protein PV09_07606 [Verruconis gallopava]
MASNDEANAPRRYKPKRKISELDESAAKRRRIQTCRAQRAFRQRNKDAIASLTSEVNELQQSIETLNTCFLTFTDDLVASGLLKCDENLAKSLQRTIERFVSVARESHNRSENSACTKDENTMTSETRSPLAGKCDGKITFETQKGSTTTTFSSVGIFNQTHDAVSLSSKLYKATAVEDGKIVTPTAQNVINSTANKPFTSFQNGPDERMPLFQDSFSYLTRTPASIGVLKLNFAQRLQMETLSAGLRLLDSAREGSLIFRRVFNCVLDSSTRELFRNSLQNQLNKTFYGSFSVPSERDGENTWNGGESNVWIYSSGVDVYFRSMGIDLNVTEELVELGITPRISQYTRFATQRTPLYGSAACYGDVFTEQQQYDQQEGNPTNLSDMVHQYPTDLDNSARAQCRSPLNITRDRGERSVSISVPRLISEIVVHGARCYYEGPAFNKNILSIALEKSLVLG